MHMICACIVALLSHVLSPTHTSIHDKTASSFIVAPGSELSRQQSVVGLS